MGVVLLKCRKCGRNYAIGNMKYGDAHKCECGAILKLDSNYIGSCDNVPLYPNMPAEKLTENQIPGFENGSSVCKGDPFHDTCSVCGQKGNEFITHYTINEGTTLSDLKRLLRYMEKVNKKIDKIMTRNTDG